MTAATEATVQDRASAHVATLLTNLIDSVDHDARAAAVRNTERGDHDAVMLTVAAEQLRQIHAGLNARTEAAE